MFKVGDKVERISNDFTGIKVGDVGIVRWVSPNTAGIRLEGNYVQIYASRNFKLVNLSWKEIMNEV